ncbi:MAG TPA: hypothetical protein DEA22_05725 [Blastocatellia bacterium]|nr:hypothetical protein [Blastocatellia bacterium]
MQNAAENIDCAVRKFINQILLCKYQFCGGQEVWMDRRSGQPPKNNSRIQIARQKKFCQNAIFCHL